MRTVYSYPLIAVPFCWYQLLTCNRGAQLHFARLALWRFQSLHGGQLPDIHNVAHADECISLATRILEEHKGLSDVR